MSWSDAFTAEDNLFRTTSTGQRVFAMVPVVGRLAVVSDADALRIQNDVRRGMVFLFVLVAVSSRLLQPWGLGVGVALAIAVAFRYWLARGLPTLSRRDVTLTPKRPHTRP